MHETPRPTPVGPPSDAPIPALALDAQALTDEEAARRAREQYREAGIPALEPDAVIGPHLADGERILGMRESAAVARIDQGTQAVHDEGPLYVTSRRLLHVGRDTTSVPLADIGELAMADDRILVTVVGARGLMLDVPEPRQFRVLLAAARSAIAR